MSKNSRQLRKIKNIGRELEKDELLISEVPYNNFINFNFQFLSDKDGLPIQKIDKDNLKFVKEVMQKMKEFSVKTLQTCINEKIYVSYGDFPNHSEFSKPDPKMIHRDVKWGRFRFGGTKRLAGFVLPEQEFTSRITFFVVFLDPNHKFYPVEKA